MFRVCLFAALLVMLPSLLGAEPLLAQDAPASGAPSVAGDSVDRYPFIVLGVGIATVLGLIIGFRVNAFLALLIAALVVSLMVGGDPGKRMESVVSAFGRSAGDVGIVIAMAAIIGKCMLDSGAADRIVRTAVNLTGERKASTGLMGSGFILAIPVFFDTVFYLLVPLARSLYRRTGRHYLRYLMAIGTGGAITHTLVPPTPGPLLVSATLGVDVGLMILVGLLVAIPSAIAGLLFSILADRMMPVAMRPLGPGSEKHEPLPIDKLPPLWLSFLPVLLPLVLIGLGTLATTLADREDRARITSADVTDIDGFRAELREQARQDEPTPGQRVVQSRAMPEATRQWILSDEPVDPEDEEAFVAALNSVLSGSDLYDAQAYQAVAQGETIQSLLAQDSVRMKPVDRRRMNRLLLEEAFPEYVAPHDWDTPLRDFANRTNLWSNANFALMLAAVVAIWTLKTVRNLSLKETSAEVEESLMTGGVIILITAAGGAFGAMLREAQIGEQVQGLFAGTAAGGVALLVLAFAIASVLKIAQGSSTVAMIVAAGIVGDIARTAPPDYDMVYVALAIGSGSLCGSWMNDSGFWVFTKMGGLTENESLKSWTLLLVVLSLAGLSMTILLSQILPLAS